MSLADLEQALSNHLGPQLGPHGFTQDSPLWFSRRTPAGAETIRLGGREEAGRCLFSGTVGIYLKEADEILSPGSKGTAPTVIVPLHFLHEEREFHEWPMSSADESAGLAATIMAEIRDYAFPFFKRYGRAESVKESLGSPDPKNWFALTPEQRICLLAALDCAAGDPDRARRVLDEALEERADALPKKRSSLEKLRDRIARL